MEIATLLQAALLSPARPNDRQIRAQIKHDSTDYSTQHHNTGNEVPGTLQERPAQAFRILDRLFMSPAEAVHNHTAMTKTDVSPERLFEVVFYGYLFCN